MWCCVMLYSQPYYKFTIKSRATHNLHQKVIGNLEITLRRMYSTVFLILTVGAVLASSESFMEAFQRGFSSDQATVQNSKFALSYTSCETIQITFHYTEPMTEEDAHPEGSQCTLLGLPCIQNDDCCRGLFCQIIGYRYPGRCDNTVEVMMKEDEKVSVQSSKFQ